MHRIPIVATALLCSASLVVAACASSGGETHVGRSEIAWTARFYAARASTGTGGTPTSAQTGDTVVFCTLITKNNAILTDIAAGDGRHVATLLHDLHAMSAAAPAEIESDLFTVIEFDRQILTRHTDIRETPQLDAAMQRYVDWTRLHCTPRKTS